MKKNVEKRGFFSRVNSDRLMRQRICSAYLGSTLVKWLDDWQAVLQLAALLFFFACALPMGITVLGIWYGAIYAYAYAFLWIGVSSLLAYREVNRRNAAMLGTEWFSNPDAIDEYIALLEKKD